ncbi:MAG TPA: LacI family DNA-binding transcriptional regulator [Microlunatus sp.]|nr:LacI family DNA-binding transcriptional regulator [Microlunatus sp.]
MSTTRRPTITTVARHAGVSPMTVSRVLDGRTTVSPELAERVHASVAALGYRRNEQARSLRPGQRSGLVGVAISNVANPYYAQFVLGAEEVLAESGRTLMIGSTADEAIREERLLAEFIGRQVEGLLVVPAGGRAHLLPRRLDGVPMVLASRQVPGIGADTVLVADVQGAYEGTAALLESGHRKIGFLGCAMSSFTGGRRLEGFRLAYEDAGIVPDESWVRRDLDDVSPGAGDHRAAADALLDAHPELTAVLCANNRNTVGLLRALARRGRLVRADDGLTVLAFDDFELADVVDATLLVIDHDGRDLGRRAAGMLVERLDGGFSGPPRLVELPTTLRTLVG